jgi:hypothetical protein
MDRIRHGARALEVGGGLARKRGERRLQAGLVGPGKGSWGDAAGGGAITGVVAPLPQTAIICR